MKTLLATLLPDDDIDSLLDVIVEIATRHGSHVVGYMPIPGPVLIPIASPVAMVPLDDSMRRRFKAELPKVKKSFETRMKAEGLSFEFRSDERISLRLTSGIVAQGRTCDMVIVRMHKNNGKSTAESAEEISDLVMSVGRPVLAVPPNLLRPFACNRVTLAWDGSREAARAAFDCVPLLAKSAEVEVVWINPEKSQMGDVDIPGAEIANVLARHDINVITKPVTSRSKDGAAIVEQAIVNASDILVLGAYGHSRLRERILGGVTEHVLRHPPCAVLLSN